MWGPPGRACAGRHAAHQAAPALGASPRGACGGWCGAAPRPGLTAFAAATPPLPGPRPRPTSRERKFKVNFAKRLVEGVRKSRLDLDSRKIVKKQDEQKAIRQKAKQMAQEVRRGRGRAGGHGAGQGGAGRGGAGRGGV
jgi:hypothetical protein